MNLEHRNDPPGFANPVVTRAEFTYSLVLNRTKIVDLDCGTASVLECKAKKVAKAAAALPKL
jgi:hypothetical protein